MEQGIGLNEVLVVRDAKGEILEVVRGSQAAIERSKLAIERQYNKDKAVPAVMATQVGRAALPRWAVMRLKAERPLGLTKPQHKQAPAEAV